MTTLYKPVLIESAKQAETLPTGTVVTHPDYWPREKRNLLGSWEGPGGTMQNAEMVGWTALAPIEAEEETIWSGTRHLVTQTRHVTPWEEA